jgi:hypothetical protein
VNRIGCTVINTPLVKNILSGHQGYIQGEGKKEEINK